jgi:hypothetical protein
MKTLFITDRIDYTGRQLRSHWIMERCGLVGDAAVGFVGSCDVSGDDLVDLEDRALGNTVAGDLMLHFIVELFGISLPGIVFAQRLLCTAAKEVVETAARVVLRREGDDLFSGTGKLSVSVATVSGVSGLIHLGLNITKDGVPVEAACLEDLRVDPAEVAPVILASFAREIDGALEAARKVRPVT